MMLPPGPHGGDGARLAELLGWPVGDVLDLSASLNPAADDPLPVLADHLGAVVRYPDERRATVAAADALDADPDRVVLTNGGAEAIALVAALHPRGWARPDDFALYRRHLHHLDPDGPRWMSDPHNPTGRLAGSSERAFVRDEAFYVLATGRWSRHDTDTVVVGSFTKAFACPGLRVGYVMCPAADMARRVEALRPRWSVNAIATAALPDMLTTARPDHWRSEVRSLRDALVALLARHGLATEPSSANFVWLPDAPGLRDALMPHGILVRSGTGFGYPDAVRIAVPDRAGLDRLQVALDAIRDGGDVAHAGRGTPSPGRVR